MSDEIVSVTGHTLQMIREEIEAPLRAEIEALRAAVPAEIAKGTYALAQEIIRLRAALNRLMAQPTQHPLKLTSEERKELWAAHEEARRALEPPP